jgi:hypothetical protein
MTKSVRIYETHEIDWKGDGVYALISDPKGVKGWYWTQTTEFWQVEAALQNTRTIAYVRSYQVDVL